MNDGITMSELLLIQAPVLNGKSMSKYFIVILAYNQMQDGSLLMVLAACSCAEIKAD